MVPGARLLKTVKAQCPHFPIFLWVGLTWWEELRLKDVESMFLKPVNIGLNPTNLSFQFWDIWFDASSSSHCFGSYKSLLYPIPIGFFFGRLMAPGQNHPLGDRKIVSGDCIRVVWRPKRKWPWGKRPRKKVVVLADVNVGVELPSGKLT